VLRGALAAHGVPGARVDLYGTSGGEAVISEYRGEARLVQEPDFDAIAERDVAFLCETGPFVARVRELARTPAVVSDPVRALAPAARLVHPDVNPDAARDAGGPLAVPDGLAGLLIELLHPLERAFGVGEATVVVLRPAFDLGEPGVEELREQTVRLLSFLELPRDVFGGQLAFNVLPQSGAGDGGAAAEVAAVLGWERPRATVRSVAVPVFHGHAVAMRFAPARAAERDDVRQVLVEAGLALAGPGERPSPVDVATESRTVVSGIDSDGLDGFWLWAVAGETAARAAARAVRVAASVCDL